MSSDMRTLTAISRGETPILATQLTASLPLQNVTIVFDVAQGLVFFWKGHNLRIKPVEWAQDCEAWEEADTFEAWGRFVNDYIQTHPLNDLPDPNWRTNRHGPYDKER